MACDITSASTGLMSPKHQGLALHLFNLYGNRSLVEDVHRLGSCITYTNVRRFLTSAAKFVSESSIITASSGIVPSQMSSKEDGGKQVLFAGDNWDHNETYRIWNHTCNDKYWHVIEEEALATTTTYS